MRAHTTSLTLKLIFSLYVNGYGFLRLLSKSVYLVLHNVYSVAPLSHGAVDYTGLSTLARTVSIASQISLG